ncbi:MAG: recombinase family protein, partial [Aureliella sp.]
MMRVKLRRARVGLLSACRCGQSNNARRRGRKYAATQGKVSVFSRAPYGYRYYCKSETGDARWEIDATESATVQLMYELVSQQGASLAAVCRELEGREILTKTGKLRWEPATIRGILLNPAYYGQARYGKERLAQRKPGRRANRGSPAVPRQAKVAVATSLDEQIVIAVPAIVSKSIFDEVRKRMDENRRRQRERQIGTKYLLSGLLICGECGSAYCYYGSSVYQYYRCIRTDAHRYSTAALCTNTSVRSAELESFIWSDLCDLLADPQRIESEFARRTAASTNDDGSQEKQQQVVKNLQARVSRLIDAYTQGLIEPSEFESRIDSGSYQMTLVVMAPLVK